MQEVFPIGIVDLDNEERQAHKNALVAVVNEFAVTKIQVQAGNPYRDEKGHFAKRIGTDSAPLGRGHESAAKEIEALNRRIVVNGMSDNEDSDDPYNPTGLTEKYLKAIIKADNERWDAQKKKIFLDDMLDGGKYERNGDGLNRHINSINLAIHYDKLQKVFDSKPYKDAIASNTFKSPWTKVKAEAQIKKISKKHDSSLKALRKDRIKFRTLREKVRAYKRKLNED